MRFAESLYVRHVGKAYILPLAVGDSEKAAQQRLDWGLNVFILSGREAHKEHGIDATPCFVVIDDEGIVRSTSPAAGANTTPTRFAVNGASG